MLRTSIVRAGGLLTPAVFCAALLLPLVGATASAETFIVEMRTVNAHPVFLPAEITVQPGDIVRWINLDPNRRTSIPMIHDSRFQPRVEEIFRPECWFRALWIRPMLKNETTFCVIPLLS